MAKSSDYGMYSQLEETILNLRQEGGQAKDTFNPKYVINQFKKNAVTANEMNDSGMWCIGTPDDLVESILRLDEQSGGFGGFMIQATEFGNREQVLRSYELIARYVMPKFQGTTTSLKASQQWASDNRIELMESRKKSIDKASDQYSKHQEKQNR